jgi:hypothetical protein
MRARRSNAWKRSVAGLAALALALGLAGPVLAKPPIWVVHGPRGVVVLFGSIHLLPPGLDWRPPALDDAVGKARELWFELPITADTSNQASALSLVRGRLPQGSTLISMLTPAQADKLQRVALKVHCSPEALAQMQPWLAEVTLAVAEDALSGASAFNGVEDQIQAITPINTPRRAFETPKQQIGFLAGAPREDQVASLNWTLHEIEDDPSTYDRVVQEWMTSDIPALQRDAIDPLKRVSPTLYERLLAERNRRWSAILSARLRQPGLVVVVVGVGHMVGQDGLPSLLRAKGYRVEGP